MGLPLVIQKYSGIKRIIYATYYSWKGLVHGFINESAFRQEVVLAFVLVPVANWLDVSNIERLLMICVVFMVMIVELLNTAIEAAIDRIGVEYHELSGVAKDTASAAVLLSVAICIFVWVSIVFIN